MQACNLQLNPFVTINKAASPLCGHVTCQLQVRDLEEAVAAERSDRQEVQVSLELLRARFREVERAYSLERERSSCAEHALQR